MHDAEDCQSLVLVSRQKGLGDQRLDLEPGLQITIGFRAVALQELLRNHFQLLWCLANGCVSGEVTAEQAA